MVFILIVVTLLPFLVFASLGRRINMGEDTENLTWLSRYLQGYQED
jgi:hypothetical protein